MGTAYTLHKNSDNELYIGEMSCKLELLSHRYFKDKILPLTKDIEPAEMMKIFLEGIKVCSYFMSKEEFDERIKGLENYSF